VQVEYYESLVKNGTERAIVYEWTGDFAVDALTVNFLEPAEAEDVRIVPAPVSSGAGQDGLTNHVIQAGSLAAGQAFTLTIRYRRQTDALSISSQPVQAVSTPGPDTPGRVSMTGILPWVLAGAGVVLILGGAAGLVAWQRGSRSGPRRPRHRSGGGAPAKTEAKADSAIYCHRCGKRAQTGDTFCRTCGTRLRRE